MSLNHDQLYFQLGVLLSEMPAFQNLGRLSTEERRWLGRACALVECAGDLSDTAIMRSACDHFQGAGRERYKRQILSILYRALARAEIAVPHSFKGSFIPVASPYQALLAIGRLLKSAQRDILIVDPYLDANALDEFCLQAKEGVSLRLLTDKEFVRPGLKPAARRWVAEFGPLRPLEVRSTARRRLHDRDILIDADRGYLLTQSLNSFATRSHASVVRLEPQMLEPKRCAYEEAWQTAADLLQEL